MAFETAPGATPGNNQLEDLMLKRQEYLNNLEKIKSDPNLEQNMVSSVVIGLNVEIENLNSQINELKGKEKLKAA